MRSPWTGPLCLTPATALQDTATLRWLQLQVPQPQHHSEVSCAGQLLHCTMPPAASNHDDFEGDEWSKAPGHKRKNKGTTVALVSLGPNARAGQQAIAGGAVNVVSAINGGISQAHAARYANPEVRREHQAYQTPEADYYRAFQKIHKDTTTNAVILRFHKTDILKVKPNGDVILNTGGYHTYTTLCSINDALQFIDMKIKVLGEVKDPDNWLVSGTGGYSMPYSDGMVIPARGPADVDRGMEILTGMRALLQSCEAAPENQRHAAMPPRAPLVVANKAKQAQQNGNKEPPKPAAAAAVNTPPPVPPPQVANGRAPPVAAGSAWAAKGSLAAKLAAETEFPPLGGGGAQKPPAAATRAAAAAASAAGAKTVPAAAGAQTAKAAPSAAAAAAVVNPPPAAHSFSPAQSPTTSAPQPPGNLGMPVFDRPDAAMHAPYTIAAPQANPNSLFSAAPAMHHHAPPMVAPAYGAPVTGYGAAPPGFAAPNQHYLPDSLDVCYGMGGSIPGSNGVGSAAPPASTSNTSPIQSSTTSSISGAGLFSPHNGLAAPQGAQQPSHAISQLFAEHGDNGDNDATLCVICMHHKHCTIMVPCSHTILCKNCADMVMNCTGAGADTPECPLCRSPIEVMLDVQ